jgi:hypothetical protein
VTAKTTIKVEHLLIERSIEKGEGDWKTCGEDTTWNLVDRRVLVFIRAYAWMTTRSLDGKSSKEIKFVCSRLLQARRAEEERNMVVNTARVWQSCSAGPVLILFIATND